MITREGFKEVMTRIKKVWEFEDELDNFYRSHSIDYCCDTPNCIDVAIDLLEYIFHDEFGWISYYVYELYWGRDYQDGDVKDKDGNVIPFKTLDDLYNMLEENLKGTYKRD